MAELLALHEISKRFAADAPLAVDGLSLTVAEGEILALLGPSGCGKTTTLRLIAGFEAPDAGTVAVRGAIVAGPGRMVAPEDRGIGIVFQDYALFPHLTVADNVVWPSGSPPRPGEEWPDIEGCRPATSDVAPHELREGSSSAWRGGTLGPAPGPDE